MKKIIKSVSYNQEQIIGWIRKLYVPEGFELDPTYGSGNFYKSLSKPILRYDILPQQVDTKQADCTNLPLKDGSIQSIMFDPPFLVGSVKLGIMKKRFGKYKNEKELWAFYKEALREFWRLLKPKGVLVFKCQDMVSSGKQYLSHIHIINKALQQGFYPKDLFILVAKHRIMSPNMLVQQHARKFHSYFLVFIKQESPVRYVCMGENK